MCCLYRGVNRYLRVFIIHIDTGKHLSYTVRQLNGIYDELYCRLYTIITFEYFKCRP